MSRQTSERLEEISCAILVPLTTTVECSMRRRIMRPRRMSVASLALAGGSPASTRVFLIFLMRELCGSTGKSTNNGIHRNLHRSYAQAHVGCVGGVSKQADGDEIDAGFGIGANVFETDAARALDGDAGIKLGAAFYCAAHVFR